LPDGGRLNTLREAVAYLAKPVPKSERNMPAVTTAAEMLTYAAEREIAWVFLARMATLQAIHRHEVRQFNPDANDHHLGKLSGTNSPMGCFQAFFCCVRLPVAEQSRQHRRTQNGFGTFASYVYLRYRFLNR
jgi:hypothetical protein